MNNDTNSNNEISDLTENRQLLWQELENCTVENPEYRELCNTLLTPVISDLKKISYQNTISRDMLLTILFRYDEYGPHQEFILSRLWQKLPDSLSGTTLKHLISAELNQQIAVNNQLVLQQNNIR
ncbi:TPA: guanylate kinase [Morganella morganii]